MKNELANGQKYVVWLSGCDAGRCVCRNNLKKSNRANTMYKNSNIIILQTWSPSTPCSPASSWKKADTDCQCDSHMFMERAPPKRRVVRTCLLQHAQNTPFKETSIITRALLPQNKIGYRTVSAVSIISEVVYTCNFQFTIPNPTHDKQIQSTKPKKCWLCAAPIQVCNQVHVQ